MSAFYQQMDTLKQRCLANKYDNKILNEIITNINLLSNIKLLQHNVNSTELTLMLNTLRKSVIKQTLENDHHE